jgi:predicted metal-dependent hydrolase
MTDLQIRRVPFRFDESTPYQWLPVNPDFGHLLNGIGVIAVAFETYIVSVVRQAFDLIADAGVADEADAFLRQEAQHARAHRLHLRALAAQHPGVKGVLDDAVASYDTLLDTEPLEFHLAYIADLEATFTPLFTMMLNNRAALFEPGDDRVASLFLWHFVEEIEHRSSALVIYDAVVGKPWYRLRVMPRVFGHAESVFTAIMAGFDAHVPPEDLMVSTRRVMSTAMWLREVAGRVPGLRRVAARAPEDAYPTAFGAVPSGDLVRMAWRLALSQLPGHRPAREPLPAFADEWFAGFESGRDVTRWFATTAAG